MWGRKRRIAAARAEREALRAEVTADVMAQVRAMLSTVPVDAEGRPNFEPLHLAVRDLPLAQLSIKQFGYDLARRLAAALPPAATTGPRHMGLGSKLSTQADLETDWAAHWCGALGTPVLFHRKLWEFAYVLQAIHDHGSLRQGARGLGFGCGEEPLPSYFAAQGIDVTVTDLAVDEAAAQGWTATGQHAASVDKAFRPYLVDRASFDARVSLEIVDMNAIPAHLSGYDFCWSVCALEHLGSIERGLAFIENALATLRPGGLAVHTTEFNFGPGEATIENWPTVLFRQRHFEALAERLEAAGHGVAPFDFDPGDGPLDRFIDLPPWGHDLPASLSRWHGDGAHLKVAIDGFACTCIGIAVRKAG